MVIGIPGTGQAKALIDMAMVNFALVPTAGNHRVIQDDGAANNGISRLFNATSGSYTDVRNPIGSLTIRASGGPIPLGDVDRFTINQPRVLAVRATAPAKKVVANALVSPIRKPARRK